MRKYLPSLLAILLASLLLTMLLQNLVGRAIVEPLLYFYWIGQLILASIPQPFIWGAFLLVALFIAARSLLSRSTPARSRPRRRAADQDRIEGWHILLSQAHQETYYQWQLAQRLQKLAVAILAHHQKRPAKEIKQGLSSHSLDMPPEILAYLAAGMTPFSHFTGSDSILPTKKEPTPLDLDPERVIQFLEEQFEYPF